MNACPVHHTIPFEVQSLFASFERILRKNIKQHWTRARCLAVVLQVATRFDHWKRLHAIQVRPFYHSVYSLRHFLLLMSSYATFRAVSIILWNRSRFSDEEEEEIESSAPASSPCCDDDGDNDCDSDDAYGNPSLIAVSACMACNRRISNGVPWGERSGVIIRLGLNRLDLLPPVLSAKKSILYIICSYGFEAFSAMNSEPVDDNASEFQGIGSTMNI